MKDEQHSFKQVHKILSALFIIFAFYIAAVPKTANAFGSNAPGAKTGKINPDDFDKEFRQARDLIDDEQWAKAAEKFGEIVNRYPDNKSADVALYWLAFCHKKQKNFKEADAALDRLLEKFPASSWASDASVMKMEIAAPLGKIYPLPASSATTLGSLSGLSAAQSPKNTAKTGAGNLPPQFTTYPGFAVAAPPVPLDRVDEIKIAAFQSLLAADPKRAIETLGELFEKDAKASDTFKQEALRVLRRPIVSRRPSVSRTAQQYSQLNQSFGFSTGGETIDKQFIPLLRETLVKGFQNETSVKIRKELVYALANIGDDQSADELARLYAAENDQEVKKSIINSFGSASNGFLKTDYAQNLQSYTGNITSTAGKSPKKGFDKLLEIVRAEKDAELRRLAFSILRGFAGWSEREGIIEIFSGIYNAETDEQFKIAIIHSLAESTQNQAAKKLLDTAKNDKSDKLRLEAIRSLGNSKNAEALKFLEDLIK
ncbi:MAG: HEAT repeat domain-containing protein [Pyrinomonadaceae bacterium]